MTLVIDCHGHYTTAPPQHDAWRDAQVAAFEAGEAPPPYPAISDGEIRATIEANQLKLLNERGADLTIFSPRASTMAHHVGDEAVSIAWARVSNDLIARVCGLYPRTFAGVCMLPQSPRADLAGSIAELERCVTELGFVGCNLNPDPGGGHFAFPALTDRYWYPFYEKMVELDVPAMIHVSGSCNPALHATGAFYIAADTIAFMQLIQGDLFADFPALRFIIPHGGGAVPYHWGRYRGLADMLKQPALASHVMENVFFDTCVYHQPGIDLLAGVIDAKNILFGSEMVGAVRGIDPETGHYFDDTKRYVDALPVDDATKAAIFAGNARRVFPRLDALLTGAGAVSGFVMDADWLPFHPAPSKPAFTPPPGAVDAHCHVFGPGNAFPYAPERKYTPCDAGADRLFALRDFLGFSRNVVVQATCHGTDNRAMADALERSGGRARGVATIDAGIGDDALAALQEAGVRGVRFNYVKRLVDPKPDAYYHRLIERIAALGWHVVVYFEAADLAEKWDFFTSLPTTVVVDHMGRPDLTKSPDGPEFARFLAFMERDNIWCKVTCPERLSRSGPPTYDDFVPFARTVVERFPDRVLWGTDWPHPNLNMVGHMPDDGWLVDMIPRIAPTADLQRRLLVENPMRLYWPEEAAA